MRRAVLITLLVTALTLPFLFFFVEGRGGDTNATPAAQPTATPSPATEPNLQPSSPGPASPSSRTDAATGTAEPQPTADEVDITAVAAEELLVEPSGEPIATDAPAPPRDKRQAAQYEEYESVATDVMTAFARPPESERAIWWDNVAPYLSERSRDDYQRVDPATVPFTTLAGPALVVPTDAPSDLLMVVLVPTDAGDYRVEMETDSAGIHVTRIVPPAELSSP